MQVFLARRPEPILEPSGAADDMKTEQQELRKLAPEETRYIVTAICEADEDARSDAGKRAAERVASDVNSTVSLPVGMRFLEVAILVDLRA